MLQIERQWQRKMTNAAPPTFGVAIAASQSSFIMG
jgi:hypothetical protein